MMKRKLAAAVPLFLVLLGTTDGSGQQPVAPPLPWDVPSAEIGAKMEAAGFRRATPDAFRYVGAPGGGFRRVANDGSAATYTRSAGGVRESMFVRAQGERPVQIFYSAVGDSAALQARLDADAAGRLGATAGERGRRVWRAGERGWISAPARPHRLSNRQYQFTVLYYAPPAQRPR